MDNSPDPFPLALSDFEFYVIRDETVQFPMVIALRTQIEGSLCIPSFLGAIQATIAKNPLLRSTVDINSWRPRWRLIPNHTPEITVSHFKTENPPDDVPLRRLDLTRTAGAEFELRVSENRSLLVSHLHHACLDGIAAIRFLADIFAEYGQTVVQVPDEGPRVRTLDPEILPGRGAIPYRLPEARPPWRYTLEAVMCLLFRKSYRMRGQSPLEDSDTSGNSLHTRVLCHSAVRKLRELAANTDTTVNDLCMLAFIMELSAWSEDDPKKKPDDLFRILMPVSMRTPEHDRIAAANVVSYVFLNQHRKDCENPQALLATIRQKTQNMVNRMEGIALLQGLAIARRIPFAFRISRMMQPEFATAVLGNVGDLRRLLENRFPLKNGRAVAGNVVIQRIDGVAPVRRNTNITMTFGTYGGELILNLRSNPEVFSCEDSQRLLSRVATRIHKMAESGDPSASNTPHVE